VIQSASKNRKKPAKVNWKEEGLSKFGIRYPEIDMIILCQHVMVNDQHIILLNSKYFELWSFI